MKTERNPYASPEARLEPERSTTEAEVVDGPTNFREAVGLIAELFPQVVLRLVGYIFLGQLAAAGVIIGFVYLVELLPDPVDFLLFFLVLLVVFSLFCYCWSICVKHISNEWRGDPTDGEVIDAAGAWLRVSGIFFVTFAGTAALVVGLFIGSAMMAQAGVPTVLFVSAVFGGVVVLAAVVNSVYFAGFAVVCEDDRFAAAFGRAVNLVAGVRNWFFAWGWGVLFAVLMGLFQVGLTFLDVLPELAALLVGNALALLFASLWLVSSYAVYRCLSADQPRRGTAGDGGEAVR